MAVKGSATVTLSQYRDTESVTRYYKLQSSSMAAPDKPTNVKPNETPAGWSKSEPACDITKTLYTCDVTVFSDKTTHVSDVSKSTSYEAAKEAWNKAQTAQNTATEATKTADNYISTDSTGIMVSENTAEVKELPMNATKSNVLVTQQSVQIRNGQKVLATYGETTEIGELSGGNIRISQTGIELHDGTYTAASIRTIAENEEEKTAVDSFDGRAANAAALSGKLWTCTYSLENVPNRIKSVTLTGPSADPMFLPNAPVGWYGYSRYDSNISVYVDGSYVDTKSWDWTVYDTVTIVYTKAARTTGTITSDEVYADVLTAGIARAAGIIAGERYDTSKINSVQKRLIIGSRKGTIENANAAAILENGDCRLGGDVYINCNNDSTGGTPLGAVTSGTGKITLTTGAVKYQPRWWRCGNIVQMEVGTKCTGKVASGDNIAAGKITGVPKPITKSGVRAVSYYGNNANISTMGSDGTFYARNAGADALAKGNDCIGGFTYITDGTML